jgi:hypothetical protein
MLVRRIDDKNVYQYKILSYESMTDRYSRECIKKKDIKAMLAALIRISVTANEFLLNADCIVLEPKYIYMEESNIYFCYYPDNGSSFCNGMKQLMEYILEHIDHNDRDTVMTAYGLYQRILKNSYTMESLMEVFEESSSYREAHKPPMEVHEEAAYHFRQEAESVQKPPVSEGLWEKMKKLFAKKAKEDVQEETSHEGTVLLSARRLVSQSGEEDILLTHFPFVIGSRPHGCDHVIKSSMVSRRHAVIWSEKGEYAVEDVGSTNGTKVNGSRINTCEKVHLEQGVIVEFANIKYRFE